MHAFSLEGLDGIFYNSYVVSLTAMVNQIVTFVECH